jgi:hypothetical protein
MVAVMLLLGAIIETPDLIHRLWDVLKPKETEGGAA